MAWCIWRKPFSFQGITTFAILAIFDWATAALNRKSVTATGLHQLAPSNSTAIAAIDDAVSLLQRNSWRRGSRASKPSPQKLKGWGAEFDCPRTVSLSGAEDAQDERMGLFTRTHLLPREEHAQRPIYVNKHRQYLFYWSDYGAWRIGPDYKQEDAGVTSSEDHMTGCPTLAQGWHVFDGQSWTSKYTVTAKDSLLNVVYGVFTSPKKEYAAQLKAVLHTWAHDVPKGKLIVVGVNGTNSRVRYNPAPDCKEGHVWNDGISCKEATLLTEGHRAGADWMVVIGSDNYVIPRHFEQQLSFRNPKVPQILGMWGCGAGDYCEDKQGGFCGGAGYAISRKALDLMIGSGPHAAESFIQESMATARDSCAYWSDQATSCVARRRNIQQVEVPGLWGWNVCAHPDEEFLCDFDPDPYRKVLEDSRPLTFHYIKPEDMYHIHDLNQWVQASKTQEASDYALLQTNSVSSKAVQYHPGEAAELSYERSRLAYIKRMNIFMSSDNSTFSGLDN